MENEDCNIESYYGKSELPVETSQLLSSYLNISTCLSPSVYNMVCNIGISSTSDEILAADFVLDWHKLDQKLSSLTGDMEDTETVEYYCDAVRKISPCITHVLNVYQEISMENFAVAYGSHLLWMQNDKIFLRAFELLQESSCPSSAVLAGLLLTASIEKALGDLCFLKGNSMPFLVKDLISSKEVEEVFGKLVAKILKIFMGPPQSLNLRNILWHGFISPSEMNIRYGYFFLAVTIGMSIRLHQQNIVWEEMKPRQFIDFSLSQILCDVFPSIGVEELLELHEIFQSSPFILTIMKENWQYCLQKYSEHRYGECIALLIPQFEHLLRVLFCFINNCPTRVLTAEVTSHYTNLTMILAEYLEDTSENRIRACLGDNIMELLFDLFIFPEGPRIRDRISHGLSDFFGIPQFLTSHLLSIAAVICSKVAKPNKSSYVDQLLQAAGIYRTRFHPFAKLKTRLTELIESLGKWKSCPTVTSEVFTPNLCDDSPLTSEALYNCAMLVGEAYNIQHLIIRFNSYSEGLSGLLDVLEECKIITIYRPKIELQLLSKLRNIADHCLKSSENIQSALSEFFSAWQCQNLRSRRKSTYNRLLKSLFTLYSGLYMVLIIIMAHVFFINKLSDWPKMKILPLQKFLKLILTYVENLNTLSDPTKNRWIESCQKTVEFFNRVNEHCKSLKCNYNQEVF